MRPSSRRWRGNSATTSSNSSMDEQVRQQPVLDTLSREQGRTLATHYSRGQFTSQANRILARDVSHALAYYGGCRGIESLDPIASPAFSASRGKICFSFGQACSSPRHPSSGNALAWRGLVVVLERTRPRIPYLPGRLLLLHVRDVHLLLPVQPLLARHRIQGKLSWRGYASYRRGRNDRHSSRRTYCSALWPQTAH